MEFASIDEGMKVEDTYSAVECELTSSASELATKFPLQPFQADHFGGRTLIEKRPNVATICAKASTTQPAPGPFE